MCVREVAGSPSAVVLKMFHRGTEWVLEGEPHLPEAFITACGSGAGWTSCCLVPVFCSFWPVLNAGDPEISQVQACLEELTAEGSGSQV